MSISDLEIVIFINMQICMCLYSASVWNFVLFCALFPDEIT